METRKSDPKSEDVRARLANTPLHLAARILDDVTSNGCRHPDTAAFYQQEKQKIQNLRFMPKVESLASSRLSYNNN